MTEDHPPLWAWMVQVEDGRWGILGASLPFLGHTQFVAGSQRTIEVLRPIAERHVERTGEPIRLVRFSGAEVLETHTRRP